MVINPSPTNGLNLTTIKQGLKSCLNCIFFCKRMIKMSFMFTLHLILRKKQFFHHEKIRVKFKENIILISKITQTKNAKREHCVLNFIFTN